MRNSIPLILLLSIVSVLTTTSCASGGTSDVRDIRSALPRASVETGCPLPVPNSFVIDYAKVIDQTTNDVLERKLRNLKSSGNIDFAIVLVDTTGEMSIFDYSLALSRCWSVGGKNPDKAGLLLLIAVNDRKWHIQISRVLEKVLSNDDVYKIGDKMAPYFKQSRYGEGVNESVDTMIETLAKRRGFFISKA